MFSGRGRYSIVLGTYNVTILGAARRARQTCKARDQSTDDRSGLLGDEVIFNGEGAKLSDDEEERQGEGVPFPATHNPVFGLGQRGAGGGGGLLGGGGDGGVVGELDWDLGPGQPCPSRRLMTCLRRRTLPMTCWPTLPPCGRAGWWLLTTLFSWWTQ